MSNLRCEACLDDENTHLLALEGLTLRHCDVCRLTSVVDPITTAVYDAEYVAQRYDRYPTTNQMSGLRLLFVENVLSLYELLPAGRTHLWSDGLGNEANRHLLDVGYGNGSFIRCASRFGWDTYGYDVNPTEYPGVRKLGALPDSLITSRRFRAISFWDCLEHFEHLQQMRRVSACTDWIFVTAPLPPQGWPVEYANRMMSSGEAQTLGKLAPLLRLWKHWRPGEHHHYFHPSTLEEIFTWDDEAAGIRTVATLMHISHFEDAIRGGGIAGQFNTFTAALRCQTFGAS